MNIVFYVLVLMAIFIFYFCLSKFFIHIGGLFTKGKDQFINNINGKEEEKDN